MAEVAGIQGDEHTTGSGHLQDNGGECTDTTWACNIMNANSVPMALDKADRCTLQACTSFLRWPRTGTVPLGNTAWMDGRAYVVFASDSSDC